MTVWQRLNAPRNKREHRVAKIARDQERERIIKLLEDETLKLEFKEWASDDLISGVHRAMALIKGEK